MAQRNLKFVPMEVVAVPSTVEFTTKSGETVSIKAIKTFERKISARRSAKKKSRK
jgi:hypothetical protein